LGLERHCRRLTGIDLEITHVGDDVVVAEALLLAKAGDFIGRGQAHLIGDGAGAHVKGAAKDGWEAERVVQLVREIGAPRPHDARARLVGVPRPDLGHRVGTREDDAIGRHRRHPLGPNHVRARLGEGNAHVRAAHGLLDPAAPILGIGLEAQAPLVGIVLTGPLNVGSLAVQDPLAIGSDYLFHADAARQEQAQCGHIGGAHADQGEAHVADVAPGELEGVHQARQEDGGRALLIIMKDGDLHLGVGAQGVQHLEALGLGDVLQVDAAVARLDEAHSVDDVLGRFGPQADRHGVDAAQVLEEERLALHHRQPRLGADVAKAQDACAVADYRNGVGFVGVLVHQVGVSGDLTAGGGHTG